MPHKARLNPLRFLLSLLSLHSLRSLRSLIFPYIPSLLSPSHLLPSFYSCPLLPYGRIYYEVRGAVRDRPADQPDPAVAGAEARKGGGVGRAAGPHPQGPFGQGLLSIEEIPSGAAGALPGGGEGGERGQAAAAAAQPGLAREGAVLPELAAGATGAAAAAERLQTAGGAALLPTAGRAAAAWQERVQQDQPRGGPRAGAPAQRPRALCIRGGEGRAAAGGVPGGQAARGRAAGAPQAVPGRGHREHALLRLGRAPLAGRARPPQDQAAPRPRGPPAPAAPAPAAAAAGRRPSRGLPRHGQRCRVRGAAQARAALQRQRGGAPPRAAQLMFCVRLHFEYNFGQLDEFEAEGAQQRERAPLAGEEDRGRAAAARPQRAARGRPGAAAGRAAAAGAGEGGARRPPQGGDQAQPGPRQPHRAPAARALPRPPRAAGRGDVRGGGRRRGHRQHDLRGTAGAGGEDRVGVEGPARAQVRTARPLRLRERAGPPGRLLHLP